MKRIISIVVSFTMFLVSLSGCEMSTNTISNQDVLTIWSGADSMAVVVRAIQEKFPDIKLDVQYYAGGNTSQFLKNELVSGNGPDLFLSTRKVSDDIAKQYLVDLSGFDFMGNVDSSILASLDVDGGIYQLPGTVNSRMFIVNKTLFEENNWKVPENFDELVDVCKQIRSEQPDIIPIGMGYATNALPLLSMSCFAQAGFLSTLEGIRWQSDYFAGKNSIQDGFEEGIQMFGRLIDADAFQYEGYENQWNASSYAFANRHIAMGIVLGSFEDFVSILDKNVEPDEGLGPYRNDDFEVIPFFGAKAGSKNAVMALGNTFGMNKRLEEKGNEKKLKNALKIFDYLTSTEGQLAMKVSSSQIVISRDGKKDIPEYLQSTWSAEAGTIKSIALYSGYEDVMMEGGKVIIDAITAKSADGLLENFVNTCDEIHLASLSGANDVSAYGEMGEDLDTEQTAQLMRNIVQAQGLADFTLATHNACDSKGYMATIHGFGGKFYKGKVNEDTANIALGDLATTIVTVALTGAEVKTLLNDGITITTAGEEVVNAPYGWSGIDVTLNDEGKVESVKFNGKELEDHSTYVVAFPNQNFTEEFAKNHEIKDSNIRISSIIEPYFKANTPIMAPEVYRHTSVQLASLE